MLGKQFAKAGADPFAPMGFSVIVTLGKTHMKELKGLMKYTLYSALMTGVLMMLCVVPAKAQHYTQTNLTSDGRIGGTKTDSNLVNPWGLSRSSSSPWWVSDNATNFSTLYGGDGSIVPLVVSVPGGPTGTVFNGTTDFDLNGKPAVFLFATESGAIYAWNGASGITASMVASKRNAVYKGLALANVHGVNYLYAADFGNGDIDVLDTNFHYVSARSLGDESERGLGHSHPFSLDDDSFRGFAPFNIQAIGANLFVTFAMQDSAKHDEVDGPGKGMVAAFTTTGRLLRIFERGSWLNAPWALAEAPGDFGAFSHSLLVGNFGSGQIAAYNEQTGRLLGLFKDASDKPIAIDGLWALSFGNDGKAGNATVLYFTAGPNGESGGLLGTLTPLASDLTLGNGN